VASQSPTDVPTDAAQRAQGEQYLNGWRAISSLLRAGKSFSGRERDCCFLNLGKASGRFADVSAALGLDSPGDGRGVAVCDWDFDGDLDFWMTSRTGPRLQLLVNGYKTNRHFLELKLRGTTSNRDAIGARIELYLPGQKVPSIRSLRAGEGFLAQASKWIHFGLGDQARIDRVVVRWPGGVAETFANVTADALFELTQGDGQAARWTPPAERFELAAASPAPPPTPAAARIVLPARLPMPELAYLGFDGAPRVVEQTGRPRLVNLWATWCQPCVAELRELASARGRLNAAGLDVLLLSVDNVGNTEPVAPEQVRALLERQGIPFERGMATPELSSLLDAVQGVIVNRYTPLPVPTSFLLDGEGRLAAIYKGPVTVAQLLADVEALPTPQPEVRNLGVPFAGRWYTGAFPPDVLALPQHLFEQGQVETSLAYLLRHLPPAGADRSAALPANLSAEQMGALYSAHGVSLAKSGRAAPALSAFRAAVSFAPRDPAAHMGLFTLLVQTGQDADAVGEGREMVRLWPRQPLAANNLAWLLATSRDPAVASPQEAIELAQRVCEQAKYQEPQALATLAEAYASAGRFADAVRAAEQGLERAQATGQDKLVERLRPRLEAYRAGRRPEL
jgi:thiol-disulfide isomerase/thioredoxin